VTALDEAILVPPDERALFFEHMAEHWPARETAASLVAAVHAADLQRAEQPVTVTVTLDKSSGSFTTQLGSGEVIYSPVPAEVFAEG
jgi:hypothetical protein